MNIEEVAKAIKDIKEEFAVNDVIKEHHISPLVDTATGKDIGCGVVFLLSTKYDYDNKIINGWQSRLKADSWYIGASRNQLRITFYIHQQTTMEWINVEDRLPELGVHVFVYGEIDPSFEDVILPGMPSKKYVWITKRINPSNVTDGNGFCRMYLRGHLDIKYWLPIPKLNGEEIFETLPVDVY